MNVRATLMAMSMRFGSEPAVCDEDLRILAGDSPLTLAGLSDTHNSDKGDQHLRSLSPLQLLCLQSTRITNASMDALSRDEHTWLLLVGTARVTSGGAAGLQDALPDSRIQTSEPPGHAFWIAAREPVLLKDDSPITTCLNPSGKAALSTRDL